MGTTQKYTAVFSHQSHQNELIGCLVVKVNTLKVIYLFCAVLLMKTMMCIVYQLIGFSWNVL